MEENLDMQNIFTLNTKILLSKKPLKNLQVYKLR